MTEHRVRMRDAEIAGECQIKSSSHTVAVDCGANRSGEVVDRLHEPLSHSGEFERVGAERDDFVQVGAGGEELLISCDEEWLRIARELFNGGSQSKDACAGEAIGSVGRSEAEDGDAFRSFDLEVFWLQMRKPAGRRRYLRRHAARLHV